MIRPRCETRLGGAAWEAFVAQCKADFGFDPATAGVIEAARRLGAAEGAWRAGMAAVPRVAGRVPGIPSRLREAQPAQLILANPGAWPGPASDAEGNVASGLGGTRAPARRAKRARSSLKLEEEPQARGAACVGGPRLDAAGAWRSSISPRSPAAPCRRAPPAQSSEISEWYAASGWKTDRSVLRALDEVDRHGDWTAVSAALTPIYRPWLDYGAKALQEAVGPEANSGNYVASAAPKPAAGEVVVFVEVCGSTSPTFWLSDWRVLGRRSRQRGLGGAADSHPDSQARLVPIDQALLGPGDALDACRASSGATAGVQTAAFVADRGRRAGARTARDRGSDRTERGPRPARSITRATTSASDSRTRSTTRCRGSPDGSATCWTPDGRRSPSSPTTAGCCCPSGLPKNESLPVAATVSKKGRCARVKDGASVDVPTVPWHWDNDVRIAVAPGISCFEANQTYEHGGVSPQECFVPRLTVTAPQRPSRSRARDHEHQVARAHARRRVHSTCLTARRSTCVARPATQRRASLMSPR